MNSEIISLIIKVVVLIIASVITTYVIPFIKSKMGDDNYKNLVQFITLCVRSAEQLFTPEQWKEKKEYVLGLAQGWVSSNLKINISDEQLDSIIEGLVNEVKAK